MQTLELLSFPPFKGGIVFSPLHPRLPAPKAQLMAGRWKGRKQQSNLYPVKFFAKDSAADLTGAINPVNPVEKTSVLSSNLMAQNGIEFMTLWIEYLIKRP